jgi:hypothetical protein
VYSNVSVISYQFGIAIEYSRVEVISTLVIEFTGHSLRCN